MAAAALGRQRHDLELLVVALVAPSVAVLGTVIDGKQEGRRRHAVDERVEQRLGLGIDPVQILEDEQHGLVAALAQQDALHPFERGGAARGGIEPVEFVLLGQRVEETQERGNAVLQPFVERQHVPRDLRANGPRVVALGNFEVGLEQEDQRHVRSGLAVGDRARLEHQPPVRAVRVNELVEQPRFADAGLADDGHHLSPPMRRLVQRQAQPLDLGLAADELSEPARHGHLEARTGGAGADDLVDLHRFGQSLDRRQAERLDLDAALGAAQHGVGQKRGAGRASCSMRAAKCVVCPTAV